MEWSKVNRRFTDSLMKIPRRGVIPQMIATDSGISWQPIEAGIIPSPIVQRARNPLARGQDTQ